MVKYILRESELCSMIEEVIKDELSNNLNEGVWNVLGKVAKTAAIGAVAPTYLVQQAIDKTNNVINGNKTIFGNANVGGSRGSSNGKTKKQSRADARRVSRADERSIINLYGEPETLPFIGRRDRLERKTQFTTQEFGNLGRHYHDVGDRRWNQKLQDAQNTLNNRGDRYRRRLRLKLKDWLDERDRAYEEYIKNHRA